MLSAGSCRSYVRASAGISPNVRATEPYSLKVEKMKGGKCMTREEKIALGKRVFEQEQVQNPCPANLKVEKIRYHEYFTSGHDDTAISISLLDADGNVLWKKKIEDSFEEHAWALTAYLENRFHCPVEEIELQ